MDPIDEIKQKLDIVTFIQPYVALKQTGRNFKGLCPFHGEKTPSFMVTPERQIWHCFGCQKGGDVIAFYQQIENIDFYEALKSLAERTGVVLKYQEPADTKQKNSLLEINQLAAKFYHYLLTEHAIGKHALEYITKERKVLPKTIEDFQIGYAPNDWRHLLNFLKKHKVTEQQAYSAGLLSKNDRGYFDMFRDRIMFPIYDHRGNVVAFAGRVLTPDAKMAKYINTPETKLYIKGNTLFGLHQTAEFIKEKNSVILVEGELDVISSYQAGVKNVVAVKGTALTQNQISLLHRYTTNLCLALDQDSAGQKATRRSIELCYQSGFTIRIATIPFGKDVDDVAKTSPKQWQAAVERAAPYYEWVIDHVFQKYDAEDPFAKTKIAQEALPFLLNIDNDIVREHYLKLLAKRLDTNLGTLLRAHRKSNEKERSRSPQPQKTETVEKKSRDIAMLGSLLSLLVQAPEPNQYLAILQTNINTALLPAAPEKEIWQRLIQTWQKQPDGFSMKSFLASLPKEYSTIVDLLFIDETDPSLLSDEARLQAAIYKIGRDIHALQLKDRLKLVTKQMATADASQTTTLTEEYNAIRQELTSLPQ